MLTELVRQSLTRAICSKHIGADGKLHAICVDPTVEQRLGQAVGAGDGGTVPLDPTYTRTLLERISDVVTQLYGRGIEPVVLTSAALRRHIYALVGSTLRGVAVLSYNEILPTTDVDVAATVEMTDAA